MHYAIMNPADIRYYQDSISSKFSTGQTLLETFKALVNGALEPKDLKDIKVCLHDGHYVALEGNRRLFLFKVSLTLPEIVDKPGIFWNTFVLSYHLYQFAF